MLKEITLKELTGGKKVYCFFTDAETITLIENALSEIRFLVDEEPIKAETPEQIMVKAETPEGGVPEPKKRRSSEQVRDVVLKSWNKGEKTIGEIVKETGLSYKQVRQYIPESMKG